MSSEANGQSTLVRLCELKEGEECECFALLVEKERNFDKYNKKYVKCHFRDKGTKLVAPIWSSDPMLPEAEAWPLEQAYRLRVRLENTKYGAQLKVLAIRLATTEQDGADGYRFHDLVESSKFPPEGCYDKIVNFVTTHIAEEPLRQLVLSILQENAELFMKMPAAQNMHHNFTGGLVEHVWSVTRACVWLARHYAYYYSELNPPLNLGVVVAAAVLHDIGKLRELRYSTIEARYTTRGTLIGHVQIGRDMIRDCASRIEGFSEETLMLLEHAILAHHGKAEYGAPKEPLTLEAMIVHYVDELDAKINAVARERMRPANGEELFTGKIYAVDNRRFYRGIPVDPAGDELG